MALLAYKSRDDEYQKLQDEITHLFNLVSISNEQRLCNWLNTYPISKFNEITKNRLSFDITTIPTDKFDMYVDFSVNIFNGVIWVVPTYYMLGWKSAGDVVLVFYQDDGKVETEYLKNEYWQIKSFIEKHARG